VNNGGGNVGRSCGGNEVRADKTVGWSLTSLFGTNMAIS